MSDTGGAKEFSCKMDQDWFGDRVKMMEMMVRHDSVVQRDWFGDTVRMMGMMVHYVVQRDWLGDRVQMMVHCETLVQMEVSMVLADQCHHHEGVTMTQD